MQTEDGFYDPDPDLTQYYQGDILREVPFPSWPTLRSESEIHKWAILRPLRSDGRPVDRLPSYLVAKARRDVEDAFQNLLGREFVVGSCQLRHVLILTRGCELDKERKQVIVAPVSMIRDLSESDRNSDWLAKVRSRKTMHKFYLPQWGSMEESFADFFKITAIHRDLLPDEAIKDRIVARLSSSAASILQIAISAFFGQSFGFDKWNECPQDGTYSCSSCFYSGRPVVKTQFSKGTVFGPCPQCGDQAEFVKVP